MMMNNIEENEIINNNIGDSSSPRLKLNELIGSTRSELDDEKSSPKIQRVVPILISDEKHKVFYQPKWISIGPIHHAKQNLNLAQEYKLGFAATFIKNSGHHSYEQLYNTIDESVKEKDLKKCFDEEVIESYNDDDLAWMLFLDGCFILQFIYSFYGDGDEDQFEKSCLKKDQIAFVSNDLFLLENQIPFRVLNLLISHSIVRFRIKLKKSMWTFIHASVMTPEKKITSAPDLHDRVNHLLDFLRLELIHDESSKQRDETNIFLKSISSFFRGLCKFKTRNVEEKNNIPIRDDKSIHDKVKEPQNKNQEEDENNKLSQQFFRSATDLKASGISIKPSKSTSLKSISFSPLFCTAELELPALIVDDSTIPKFVNIIAYEMCPDNFNTDYEVTSYISMLDTLIDYATDVKELRSAKVLINYLGSDKELARRFNEIARYLVPNSQLYQDVVNQIEDHYRSNFKIWIAQFLNEHFSSPWTLAAFLGAVFVIILTLLQTWYTIYSPPGPCDDFCHQKN